ncbi:glycosyltransferase family 9 protein [Sediminibacterium soli]|uniref:glycosyltransferase family 9 protein n=1 Tax=Sediminibacterium soli TaxID=2698829 RepID=UPI00137B790B|nr:glycosyltransferase family 9 protein [Sediminibacterium soli]NCI47230.1 glycosyltransferase family 9 protein [Sediminibacterium soli]
MKFLIIRLSSIGDIVLTTPVIRCLKQQVTGAEVHFLTKETFRGILADNPYIDRVITLGNDWDKMIGILVAEQYDHIIDLHHNLRTLRIKRAMNKVPADSFSKLNLRKWLLTALKINTLPRLHIVDRYLETVKKFGVVNDGAGLDYFIPEKDRVSPEDLPTSHQMGYIGLVIGAALNTKKLPVVRLRELCLLINYPIVLLGGPEDMADAVAIAAADPVRVYNACGKFRLNESADIVRNARLIITHDTGLMHIGAAFKKNMISIWGNTVPAFGMDAYYGAAVSADTRAEVQGLWCRPCSKIGYAKCPLGHFKCMQQQDVRMIAAAAIQKVTADQK